MIHALGQRKVKRKAKKKRLRLVWLEAAYTTTGLAAIRKAPSNTAKKP